jgi:hypothetical protein
MWYPILRDDFSVMGDDVFSNLIRNSSVRESYSIKGVTKLEAKTMTKLSRDIFLGKKSTEITEIFTQAQGYCDAMQQMNLLTCNVVRQWQFKNVGIPTDTSELPKPTVKLLFRFALSDSHAVTDLELKIIDLTNQTQ